MALQLASKSKLCKAVFFFIKNIYRPSEAM